MKREGHSRSHAAMLVRQPIKRSNGLRVAQDNSNLATFGNVRGLALCAGLGLGHGSGINVQVMGGDDFVPSEQLAVMYVGIACDAVKHNIPAKAPNVARGGRFAGTRAADVVCAGGNLLGLVSVHGLCLPLGNEAGTDEVFSAGNVGLAGGCVQIAQLHGRGFRRGAGSGFVKGFSKRAVDRVHGLLRAGRIPAMWERYAVTSDIATTVRREFLNNRRAA